MRKAMLRHDLVAKRTRPDACDLPACSKVSVARSARPPCEVTALVAPEQRKNMEAAGKVWHSWNSMEYCGRVRDAARASGRRSRGAAMIRDFGAKLRITAAALGCASQKDLCARFREANPGTIFELDRSYKWMQGRALPRSVGLYEDWAALLGTGRPLAWLQSCTVDEFLELLSRPFRGEPRGARRAGGARRRAASRRRPRRSRGMRCPAAISLGAYACYSPRLVALLRGQDHSRLAGHRGRGGAAPGCVATYRESGSQSGA